MSLIHRERTCRLFWCYQCQRTVRIISSSPLDVFCPRCYGQFLHEIELPRPRLHHYPFYPLFGLSTWRRDTEHDRFRGLALEDQTQDRSGVWVIFRRTGSGVPHFVPPRPQPSSEPSPSIPPMVHPGDYFAGQNLDELIDELTQNDRAGLPPAPSSAIDAMPTVYVTEAHLSDGSQCPVCKEEFELGETAREMPCKHVYHSDCIVPWLRIHNSCPVCRFQLPANSTNSVDDDERRIDDDEDLSSGGEGTHRAVRWNPFSMLWPSRTSSPRWDYNYGRQDPDPLDSPSAFYAWWRSWFLL